MTFKQCSHILDGKNKVIKKPPTKSQTQNKKSNPSCWAFRTDSQSPQLETCPRTSLLTRDLFRTPIYACLFIYQRFFQHFSFLLSTPFTIYSRVPNSAFTLSWKSQVTLISSHISPPHLQSVILRAGLCYDFWSSSPFGKRMTKTRHRSTRSCVAPLIHSHPYQKCRMHLPSHCSFPQLPHSGNQSVLPWEIAYGSFSNNFLTCNNLTSHLHNWYLSAFLIPSNSCAGSRASCALVIPTIFQLAAVSVVGLLLGQDPSFKYHQKKKKSCLRQALWLPSLSPFNTASGHLWPSAAITSPIYIFPLSASSSVWTLFSTSFTRQRKSNHISTVQQKQS